MQRHGRGLDLRRDAVPPGVAGVVPHDLAEGVRRANILVAAADLVGTAFGYLYGPSHLNTYNSVPGLALDLDSQAVGEVLVGGYVQIAASPSMPPPGSYMRGKVERQIYGVTHAESVLVDGIGTVVFVPVAARPSAMTRMAPRRAWN